MARAVRASVPAGADPADVVRAAGAAGVLGWVRAGADGTLSLHAEGDEAAVGGLLARLGASGGEAVRREGRGGGGGCPGGGSGAVRGRGGARGGFRRAGARGARPPLRPAPRG